MTAVESQVQELHCPLCDYNLRGLSDPRCPECGYAFEWSDLTDPARQKHPYLFEHHPEKNVRSFVRTVIGHVLPRRFWRALRPQMPSKPRRLLGYWLVLVASCLLCFIAPLIFNVIETMIYEQHSRQMQRIWLAKNCPLSELNRVLADYGSIENYVHTLWPAPNTSKFWINAWRSTKFGFRYQLTNYRGLGAAMFITWPWMTLLIMRIFRVSMRRARINPMHILRALIYSSDTAIWFVGLYLAALVLTIMLNVLGHLDFNGWQTPQHLTLAAIACAAITLYRLWVAFKLYLKFDHALAVAIPSQTILCLVVLTIIDYTPGMLKYVLECFTGLRYGEW
jgi:hypothetical protein